MEKRYYIEIWENDGLEPFILQSKWFDTEEQALAWLDTIDYIDNKYSISLMSGMYDKETDCYEDIDLEYNIGDLKNGKSK